MAFAKQTKWKKKQTSSHPRHMTGAENLEALARADWDAAMKVVFHEAVEAFKERRMKIDNHYKALTREDQLQQKRDKAAERLRNRMEKLSAAEAEKEAKRQEKLKQRALKAAEMLQRKQKKSMAAQACKSKAPARGPTTTCRPHPPPTPDSSSESEGLYTEEGEEEIAETSSEGSESAEAMVELSAESHPPLEGVRRSSRLAKAL
jgi:hypothetical protein